MSERMVWVGRRDLFREAVRAEKRRLIARLLVQSGPERERLLREIVAANEIVGTDATNRRNEGATCDDQSRH
jgi:hypothetical protein